MKRFSKLYRAIIFSSILLIFACVTINIYFPAEKVESVAGEIVEEIRGSNPEKNEDPKVKGKSSRHQHNSYAVWGSVAWAEDVTTVSNPTIRTLKQRMKDRFAMLRPYFQTGLLKEANNGYVSIGDDDKLSLKERRNLKNLVEAENQDRKTLYLEVAKALNIDPGQTDKVAAIFAKEWQRSLQ